MKKGKIALAVGLSLAVGLTGASLVACTPGEGGGSSLSPYYLTGASAGGLMREVNEEFGWYNGYTSNDNVPEGINFRPVEGEVNTYTLTAMLYTDDMFQILIIDRGWGGQMGYEILDKKNNEGTGLTDKPGDGYNSNFKVGEGKSGTYTLTLKFDEEGNNPKLTYTRTAEYTKLDVPVTSIALDQDTATIKPDETLDLKATIKPDYSNRTLSWKSSDESVATVDATGKVTAKANGEADITVTVVEPDAADDDDPVTATCKVKVTDNIVAATSVTLKSDNKEITEKTLHVGETVEVDATIAPDDSTTESVKWASDAEAATVTKNATNPNKAVVTAVKPGEANITATADEAVGTLAITVEKDYYLIGNFGNDKAISGWNSGVKYSEIDADAKFVKAAGGDGATTWTLTGFDLYTIDDFKIGVLGADRNKYEYGNEKVVDGEKDDEGKLKEKNINVSENGKYTIVVTEDAEGEVSISINKTGEAAPLVFDKILVQIAGKLWDENKEPEAGYVEDWAYGNGWGQKEVSAANNWTYTYDLTLAAGDEFQVVHRNGKGAENTNYGSVNWVGTYNKANETGGLPDGTFEDSGNIKCKAGKGGTYTITAVYNESGALVSLTIVAKAAE